jgi:hypothetical protein
MHSPNHQTSIKGAEPDAVGHIIRGPDQIDASRPLRKSLGFGS